MVTFQSECEDEPVISSCKGWKGFKVEAYIKTFKLVLIHV